MKTTTLKGKLIVINVVSLISASAFLVDKEHVVKDIYLNSNVEALAAGEGGGAAYCYGTGSLDCCGNKVSHIWYRGLELDE